MSDVNEGYSEEMVNLPDVELPDDDALDREPDSGDPAEQEEAQEPEEQEQEPQPQPSQSELERLRAEMEVLKKGVRDKDSYISRLEQQAYRQPPPQQEQRQKFDPDEFLEDPESYLQSKYVTRSDLESVKGYLQQLGHQVMQTQQQAELSSFYGQHPDAKDLESDMIDEIKRNEILQRHIPATREGFELVYRLVKAERELKNLKGKPTPSPVDEAKKQRAQTTSSNATKPGKPGTNTNLLSMDIDRLERLVEDRLAQE